MIAVDAERMHAGKKLVLGDINRHFRFREHRGLRLDELLYLPCFIGSFRYPFRKEQFFVAFEELRIETIEVHRAIPNSVAREIGSNCDRPGREKSESQYVDR